MSDFENNDNNELEFDTVTLTLEDDTEMECAILAVYEAGDHQYAALVPFENDEIDEDAGVMIFRYVDNGTDEPSLENIESDEEYEMACDAFDELLDDEEFDEEEH
ncbi:MAG: DUF1292 domain-containing protein [Lachnospiraceae bacterium]|nr:DUF1292 domain-containing protein [Lachnospiraceae bacterium]